MAVKVNTRFTERSKHQLTEKGTVFEHGLSTLPDLASITKLDNFQIPVYKSGNLVITRDTEQAIRRNVKGQSWARNESGDTWNGEMLSQYPLDENSSDATAIFNYDYSRLEHFAYYGSAMELLRVSVGNIVSKFPGELYVMAEQSGSTLVPVKKQYRDKDGVWKYASIRLLFGEIDILDTLIDNPFSIDLFSETVNRQNPDFDPLKYFCQGLYTNYICETADGVKAEIVEWQKYYLVYHADLDLYEPVTTPVVKKCYLPGEAIAAISIKLDYGGMIVGFPIVSVQGNDGEVFYLAGSYIAGCHFRPRQSFLEAYYDNLEPFEHYLLNPYSSPRYMARFVVRHFGDTGEYKTLESFVFPTGPGGYNIAVDGPGFEYYVQRLTEVAMSYDESITDNLWRAMVHESIKNFDWTTDPAAKEDYTDGAGKLEKVLRVIAAFFDRIKSDIDNLDHTETVTYSGKDNVANYSLSDLVALKGIEPVNVIPLQHTVVASGVTGGEETICSNLLYDESGATADIAERYFTVIDSGVTPYSGSSLGYFEVCCGVQVPAQPGEEIKVVDRYYVGYNNRKLYFDCDNKLNMIDPTGGTVQYDKPLTGTTINLPYYVEGETAPRYSDYEIYREQTIITRTSTFVSDTPLTANEFNYEFLRRLKLNAPGILRKKGTIAGVEEILSLFNLKSQRFVDRYCGDKTIAADYKIEESTLYTTPITDTYDTRYRMPYYDYLNTTKSFSYNTDNFKAGVYDAYRGLPVKPVNFYITSEGTISRQKYEDDGRARRIDHRLVYPYFDKNLPHDGNLYYQMYGGWLNKDLSFSKDGLTLCRNRYPYNFTVTLRNVYAVSCPDNLAGIPANKLHDGFYCEVEDSSKKYLNVNGTLYEIFYETKNITNSSILVNGYYDCAYIKITLGPDGKLVGDKFYDGMVYVSDPCYNGFLNPVNTAALANDTTQKIYLYRIDTSNNKIPVGSQILSTAHVGEVSIDLYKSTAGVISEVALSELVTDNDEYSSYWKLEDKAKGMQYAMTDTPAPQYDGGWVRLRKDSDDVAYLNTIITRKDGNNPHSARVGYDNGLAYIDRFASLFYDAYPDNINETCLRFTKESYGYEDFGFTNLYDASGATIAYLDTKTHAFCDRLNTSGLTTIYGDTGNTLFDIVRHGTGDTYPTLGVNDSDPRRVINTKYVDITFFLPPITGSSAEIDRYKYYDSVVVAYLEQILPPTIICNINYEIAEEKCLVKVHTLPLNAGPTTGTGVYDCGSAVTISASDGTYYEFEKWSDGYTGNTRTVIANGDVTYFAKYHGKDMVLKVGTDNLAQGTVTPYQPTGDTAEYGSVVRLMALPAAQYRFDHWRVDGVDTTLYNSIVDVEIDKPVTEYIAVFRPRTDTFIIQTSSNNDEWGYVTGGKDDALYGEILKLEATPYDCCYGFAYWCDDTGNTNPTRFVTAVTDASYIAIFTARTYTLTLSVLPAGQTWGTVSGAGTYECGYVTIEATPADSCYFVGWSDGNTNATRSYYLNADTTLNATFAHYGELVVRNHPDNPAGCNFIVNGSPYGASWGTEYDNARVKTNDSFTVTPQPAMGYIAGVWSYDFYDVNPGSTADYSANLPNNGVATLQLTGNTTPVNSAVLTIECYGCNRDVTLLYDDYMTYRAVTKKLVTGTTPYSYQSLTATTVIKGSVVSGTTVSSYGTDICLSAVTVDPRYELKGWEVKTDNGQWLAVNDATGCVPNTKGGCNNTVIIRPVVKPRGRVVTIDKYDHGSCGLIGFEITGQTMQDVDTVSTGVEECESITLKASPCTGCTFVGWYDTGGMLVSTATAYTITPTEDVTYRPKFMCAGVNVNLTGNYLTPGCALVSASTVSQAATAVTTSVPLHGTVVIEGVANPDCDCVEFWKWLTPDQSLYSTDNPLTLSNLTADTTLVAKFKEKGPQSITGFTNDSNLGLVIIGTGTTSVATGTTSVPCGHNIQLTAVTVGDCGVFSRWENVDEPTETYTTAVINVTVTQASRYRAVFAGSQKTVSFVRDISQNNIKYSINGSSETVLPAGVSSISVNCGDEINVQPTNEQCCYWFNEWYYTVGSGPRTQSVNLSLSLTVTADTVIEQYNTDQFSVTAKAVDLDGNPFDTTDPCFELNSKIEYKQIGSSDFMQFPYESDCENIKIRAIRAAETIEDCCYIFDHWEIDNEPGWVITENPHELDETEQVMFNFCHRQLRAVYRMPRYVLDFSKLGGSPEDYFQLDRTATAITMPDCIVAETQFDIPACISIINPETCFDLYIYRQSASVHSCHIKVCGGDTCYLLPHYDTDCRIEVVLGDCNDPVPCNDDPDHHPCQCLTSALTSVEPDPSSESGDDEAPAE